LGYSVLASLLSVIQAGQLFSFVLALFAYIEVGFRVWGLPVRSCVKQWLSWEQIVKHLSVLFFFECLCWASQILWHVASYCVQLTHHNYAQLHIKKRTDHSSSTRKKVVVKKLHNKHTCIEKSEEKERRGEREREHLTHKHQQKR